MKNNTQESKKPVYIFGTVLSLLMLIAMIYEWALPTSGWLRAMNNSWAAIRTYSPVMAHALFSGNEKREDYSYLFGKFIYKSADPRIVIGAIDNHTLNNLGYPFPRKYYGELIEKLNKLGAKVVVMDVLTIDNDKYNQGNDAGYVNAVKKAGNVVSAMAYDRWNKTFQFPIKGLLGASRYIAIPSMDKRISKDNHVRDAFLFDPDGKYSDAKELKTACHGDNCGDINLAGLAPAAYAIYNKMPLSAVWAKYGADDSYAINYRYPVTRQIHAGWSKKILTEHTLYPWISVLDIIQGKLSAEEKRALKGAVVMVGSVAIGAYDHYPSVFIQNLPGVEVHANVLDNMLNNDFLRPVNGWLVALIVLICIWTPIFLRKSPIALLNSIVVAALVVAVVADYYMLHRLYNSIFAHIAVALILPFVFVTIHKALVEGREKKWIKNTFGQYLSPKVVEIITKDPSKLSLGGEKRDMTAFFLDIAGFTTISEKLTPQQLTKMMNTYLSGFTDVILRHDGVVDKYIGDCIMAFWNAPLDQKDHRKLACLAAVDCLSELHRLNESSEYSIKPDCRIGLNSGFMVVGNMGSNTRMSYTVMGDTVNLASRLEGANKFFHSKIMVSEYTYDEAKDFIEARMLGQIRVVGKAIPVKVYEPLAHKGKLSAEVSKMREAYNEGYAKFYKGAFAPARKAFEAALAVIPADGPSKFYLDLAVKYAEGTPKDWDGTFNLTSK